MHAIVVGGGIAGLLAARVLLKHYEQVTLIERDQYPKEPVFRSGVPQGRQVHTTLLRGQRVLEDLFPGLGKKLQEAGAIVRDYGNEPLYYYGGRCPSVPAVLRGWNCSRLLLEWQIRRELEHYSQLRIMEGYEVVHLLYEQETRSVLGIQYRERSHQSPTKQEIQELRGNLVVDASGLSSRTPQWLEELGYKAPRETVVDAHLGYATRYYAPSEDLSARWKGMAIQGTQDKRRGGVLMTIEGGLWMVVIAGTNKDYPPVDEEGYLAFARSLPDSSLYEAIQHAKPISPIYGYRRTENRFRHFERIRLPEQLLILGDAVCGFNPLYGQGITIAALEAVLLDTCLRKGRKTKGLTQLFQRKLARLLALPWQLATGADSRTLEASYAKRIVHHYMENLIALLPHDPIVLLVFLEVLHMLRSPLALLHPRILAKVMFHAAWNK